MAKIDVYEAGCRIEGLAATMDLIMEDLSDEISAATKYPKDGDSGIFWLLTCRMSGTYYPALNYVSNSLLALCRKLQETGT